MAVGQSVSGRIFRGARRRRTAGFEPGPSHCASGAKSLCACDHEVAVFIQGSRQKRQTHCGRGPIRSLPQPIEGSISGHAEAAKIQVLGPVGQSALCPIYFSKWGFCPMLQKHPSACGSEADRSLVEVIGARQRASCEAVQVLGPVGESSLSARSREIGLGCELRRKASNPLWQWANPELAEASGWRSGCWGRAWNAPSAWASEAKAHLAFACSDRCGRG